MTLQRTIDEPYLGECVPPGFHRDDRRFILEEFAGKQHPTAKVWRFLGGLLLGTVAAGAAACVLLVFILLFTKPAASQEVRIPTACMKVASQHNIPKLISIDAAYNAYALLLSLPEQAPGARGCKRHIQQLLDDAARREK